MKLRLIYLAMSLTSLFVGAGLYAFFRQDSHIGGFLAQLLPLTPFSPYRYPLLAFYLPDFLWAFSLNCGLLAAVPTRKKYAWVWSIVVCAYGALWESAQFFGAVGGTADWIDVLLYVSAVFAVAIINYFICEEKSK